MRLGTLSVSLLSLHKLQHIAMLTRYTSMLQISGCKTAKEACSKLHFEARNKWMTKKKQLGDDVTITVIDIPAVTISLTTKGGGTKVSRKQPPQAVVTGMGRGSKIAPLSSAKTEQDDTKSATCNIL